MIQRFSIFGLIAFSLFIVVSFNACGGGGGSATDGSQNDLAGGWKITNHSTDIRAQIPNNNVRVLSMTDDGSGLLISLFDHHNTRHRIVRRDSSGQYTLVGRFEGSEGVVVDGVNLGGAYTTLAGHYGNLTDGLRVIANPYIVNLKTGTTPTIVKPNTSTRIQEVFNHFSPIPGTTNTILSTTSTNNTVYIYNNTTTLQMTGGNGAADFFIDANNEVWYINMYDHIMKWTGTTFTKIFDGSLIETDPEVPQVSVNSIYVRAPNDIYLAIGHKIFHYDGSTWTVVHSSAMSYFTRVRGNGEIVVAVGDNGLISIRNSNGVWADGQGSDFQRSYLTQIHFPAGQSNAFWAGGMNQLYYVSK